MIQKFSVKKNRLFAPADYSAILSSKKYLGYTLERNELAPINITQNAVCMFDPYTSGTYKPFYGNFPDGMCVPFSCSVSTNQGNRIALAGLEFSREKAEVWKLALYGEKDVIKLLNKDETISTLIDSGFAAFGSYSAARAFNSLVKNNEREFHPLDGTVSMDGFTSASYGAGENSFAVFSSGWGDGEYECYIGYGSGGDVRALLCDFQLAPLPKRKDDNQTVDFEFDMSAEDAYIYDPKLSDLQNSINKWSITIENESRETPANLFNAYSRRGYAYHNLGKSNEALSDYLKALELGTNLEKQSNFKFRAWTFYDNIGAIYREQGKTEEALKIFSAARSGGDSFYANAYLSMADIYIERHDYISAKVVADDMVNDRPKDPSAYNKRFEICMLTEEYENALSDAQILISVFKLNESILDKANCLLRLDRYDDALTALDEYLIEGKPSEIYFFSRAQLYYIIKNYGEAYANLLNCYDYNPDYQPCLQILTEMELLTYNNTNAVKFANRYIELMPNSAFGYHHRAIAYLRLKDYENAQADYDFLIDIKKDAFYMSMALRSALIRKENLQVKKYLKMLRKSSTPYYINAVGLVMSYRRKFLRAERYLVSAFKLEPSELFLSDLIESALFNDNAHGANIWLKKMIELFPDSEELLIKSAQILNKSGRQDKLESIKNKYIEHFLNKTENENFIKNVNAYFNNL